MIKILIVEDEPEKKRLLIEAALEVATMTLESIDSAPDVIAAKKAIKQKKYDLLILDINIPMRPDQRAQVGAGLDVLRYIRTNLQAIPPAYIVGMTAYEAGLNVAASDFSSPLWKLLTFSYSDLSWKEPLKQAIEYLIAHDHPPYINDGRSYHIDLGIVVALEGVELESIKNLDANWQPVAVPYDPASYLRGTFANEDVTLDVVVVACPKMGMPAAAVVASKLIQTFQPRYLAITGICAGVRGKTNIGDILVADPCFDWGSGKWVRANQEGALKFRPAPYPWRLSESLRSGVNSTATPDLLESIYTSFHGPKPRHMPTVIVEAMASGGAVLQASELMDDVREQHKNLVGIEMESYAVFTAAEYAAEPRPKCIAIKSVCDFGDDEKSDDYHQYAAHTSAQFLFQFALKSLVCDG